MRPALSAAVFAAAVSLLAVPAAAQSSDAPISTGASADVSRQIQQYLDTSPAVCGSADEVEILPDRRPHGEVSVAVGSHGYRSAYVRSDIPVGYNGTVSVAVGESRGGLTPWGRRAGRQQQLALGFDFSRPRSARVVDPSWAEEPPPGAACDAGSWSAGPATQAAGG